MSKLSTLVWLRCATCVGHLGWLFKLNLHPRHQHCTDEAQKAETVLSAGTRVRSEKRPARDLTAQS